MAATLTLSRTNKLSATSDRAKN